MLTKMKIMKGTAVAGLFLLLLWPSIASYQLALEAALFLAIFVITNKTFFWLSVVCFVASLLLLGVLKSRPRLSMPAITNQIPGSKPL